MVARRLLEGATCDVLDVIVRTRLANFLLVALLLCKVRRVMFLRRCDVLEETPRVSDASGLFPRTRGCRSLKTRLSSFKDAAVSF